MSETPKLPPISELRAIAEKATPGPWEVVDDGKYSRGQIRAACKGLPKHPVIQATGMPTLEERAANTTFVATFNPKTILALLSRIEELEGALRKAPVPVPRRFELALYTDWYFIVRGAALGGSDG